MIDYWKRLKESEMKKEMKNKERTTILKGRFEEAVYKQQGSGLLT